MPPDVRMSYLLDTASSNLLYEALLGLLFAPAARRESGTQLKRCQTNV
jgi:hypothetical protein